jgi:paraquat-inducible protein B
MRILHVKDHRIQIRTLVQGVIALLAAVAIMLIISSLLTSDKSRYVLYFEESIAGLKIGTPVTFRGVKVGSVRKIQLLYDNKGKNILAPVIIDLEPGKFVNITSENLSTKDSKGSYSGPLENLQIFIRSGIRAQLVTKDQFTGDLMILLDFQPDTEILLRGSLQAYPEIPTVPSTDTKLNRTIEDIDVEGLYIALLKAAQGIERFTRKENITGNIENALMNMNLLLKEIIEKLDSASK